MLIVLAAATDGSSETASRVTNVLWISEKKP